MNKRIAFAGTRGLPANYGGFETAVDEITNRFISSGFEVDVFCRRSHSTNQPHEDKKRRLLYVKGSSKPWLETFASAYQTGTYLLKHRHEYDHVFWFNNANFPGILLTLFTGIPVTVNTDGLEWRRRKWTLPFKIYYYSTSWLISRIVPRLISDSCGIQSFYKKIFWRDSLMIPYGVPKSPEVSWEQQAKILQSFGLESDKYYLQITRIEPDNLPVEIATNFRLTKLSDKGYKLLIVGYKDETPYSKKLFDLNGKDGIIINPANYDQQILYSLRKNCFCYIHGNSVGGTNPALLEAMSVCPRIMAIDVVFNKEVLGPNGNFFSLENLYQVFSNSSAFPNNNIALKKTIMEYYNWDDVSEKYLDIVKTLDHARNGLLKNSKSR